MKHPNPQIQQNQEEFLKQLPEEERSFHAALFRVGNAAYRYHQLANTTEINDKTLQLYFREWLDGLPINIRISLEEKGFEYCKTTMSFTRYVNERQDIGMDEWMKEHLSEDDYKQWNSNKST